MKLPVTFHTDEDGAWIAQCPSIPGCVSQGATRADTLLAGVTKDNLHPEIDTGPPVGKEMW